MSASRSLVSVRQFASPRDDLRQALQLLPPDRRLDIGHAVVVADRRIRLEDDLARTVADRVGHAHRMLPQQAELAVPFGIGAS